MIPVKLEWYEMIEGAHCGLLRKIENMRKYPSVRSVAGDEWQNHIEGACAEVAVSKYLNVYWPASVNTMFSPDMGKYEVRCRSNHNWDLIVREKDADDLMVILVTGSAPNFIIRGWIRAGEAKQAKWIKDYGNYQRPAYFVPQSALKPLERRVAQ